MSHKGPGSLNLSLKWVNFFWVVSIRLFRHLRRLVSLRYQLIRRYNVSKTSVLFRYQLWHLCDVLIWSVSLRYQLVRRYDVSNLLLWTKYLWDVTKTSQVGGSHSRTSRDVVMTLSMVLNVSTYMIPKWYVAMTSHAGLVSLLTKLVCLNLAAKLSAASLIMGSFNNRNHD